MDVLLRTEVVPYETIKGGQEYVISDYSSGTYRMVAWAVPAGAPYGSEIPVVTIGESYHEVALGLSRMTTNTSYYQPMGEIFLGESMITIDTDESSRHEISLVTCICKVYFTLHRAHLLGETKAVDDETWIILDGTRTEMMADRSCGGEPTSVYQALSYQTEEQTLFSGVMGVLPAEEEEYLKVTMYKSGEEICRVETQEVALAGDEIWIEATLGVDVAVYVNGWRVKNVKVDFSDVYKPKE
ncbi:MAG: FimB/Mfa2 family fimbrial subunit [Tannerellaceae bacterium]|nr:FimB/Mfa2 family fimbrial subunit [Tannerellaceae bacterium]